MTPTTDLHKLSATDVVRLLKERLVSSTAVIASQVCSCYDRDLLPLQVTPLQLVEAAAHRIQASHFSQQLKLLAMLSVTATWMSMRRQVIPESMLFLYAALIKPEPKLQDGKTLPTSLVQAICMVRAYNSRCQTNATRSVCYIVRLKFSPCRAADSCEGSHSSQGPSLHSGENSCEGTIVFQEHLTFHDADSSAVSAGQPHLQRQHCCDQ